MSSTNDRVAQGKRDVEKRWGPYRAARIAAGLPATRGEEVGRPRRYFEAGSDEEAHWLRVAEDRGLITADMARPQRRRIAYSISTAKRETSSAIKARRSKVVPVVRDVVTAWRANKATDDDLRKAVEAAIFAARL